jgi:SPP1 family phage portal protein
MAVEHRPYNLPEQMTCDESEVQNGISLELVEKYIKKHQEYFSRYKYLDAMYRGFHDIYKDPEKPYWKPDNRLAVNFPRYITETFSGYGYGIPIKVRHDDEKINAAIQLFGRENKISDHDAEMVKKCCIYGHAFEYLYQDEEGRTKLTSCTPMQVFVVYDNKLNGRALFAVRYGKHKLTDSINPGKHFGEILTGTEIVPFDGKKKSEPRLNPYGYIPCNEWRLNDERIGLYEHVCGLIEAYNRVIGEKANDVEAFAEAYLAVLGAELDDDGVYKIRDNRIINLYGTENAKDVLVQFLSKPTADGTQENLLNRLENLIYQTSMVANITDESFGTATSGVAIAYKLQAMSNLALTFDRKIEKSLRNRYKIFCSLSTNVSDPEAYQDIEIQFSRNIPQNIKEETEVARSLEGVTSRKTQLSVLSFVPDATEEIERMEAEEEEQLTRFARVADERQFLPGE